MSGRLETGRPRRSASFGDSVCANVRLLKPVGCIAERHYGGEGLKREVFGKVIGDFRVIVSSVNMIRDKDNPNGVGSATVDPVGMNIAACTGILSVDNLPKMQGGYRSPAPCGRSNWHLRRA